MYPSTFNYEPISMPQYAYGTPYHSRNDRQYLQTLAEEAAARRQYEQALREQEEARTRAARARLARQTFGNPSYDSYLDDDNDDEYDYGLGPSSRTARSGYSAYPGHSYLTPQEQHALIQERQRMEQQRREQRRRIEAIEREREMERQRTRVLEEERKRRLLEEERRRRIMLEEEERQRRREEERRRREEEEYFRQSSAQTTPAFFPLEELLGLRPSRSLQPEVNASRRARTMSPGDRNRSPHPTTPQAQRSQGKTPVPPATRTERASSRPPRAEPQTHGQRIHISSPQSSPAQPQTQPHTQQQTTHTPPPRRYGAKETEAAAKIQAFWRARHRRRTALESIAALADTFERLRAGFVLPPTLDYTLHGTHFAVPTAGSGGTDCAPDDEAGETGAVASLAFTPTNVSVHAYEEELSRVLTRLDDVLSGGDERVRQCRRELVRKVEREAERIEKMKKQIWRAFVEKQKGLEEGMQEGMPMDEVMDEMETSEIPAEPAADVRPSQPFDSLVEEMQLDASVPSEPQDVDVAAEEPLPDESAAEMKDVDLVDGASQQPSEPSVQDAEVIHMPQHIEKMDVEHIPSNDFAERIGAGQPGNAEPADVILNDAERPASVEEEEEEEEEKLGEHVVVEMSNNGSSAQLFPAHSDSVSIVIEEPDPDADENIAESSDIAAPDANDSSNAEPIVESTDFTHTPFNTSVVVPEPVPASEPMSSPPELVDNASEAGDADHILLHTPPATLEELAHRRKATPKPRMSPEKLQMLRPLVSQEWDEWDDFF
ncbi:uncharacterized protein PHACADRAFT_198720 [Phanerochaete carnosa HHB-10118-sp]|uniref:BAG domain-containing protein n=1 Tax=Phanerochaete carnosa (strain HHB-10118-sp) TaxID=650164 RepID=K5VMH7_PHACS|nr:uncharacterized protein PHACADRAFT_198720 [Phanerochaete carnosa HHB-10118-sp]EKM52673.1 hypothetical protein PHACADRAFT_198720 [Phanerochaete carnosa HHB-10118-sp]